MIRADISKIVRDYRMDSGLSQSQLADRAGISTSTVKAIETNRMQGSYRTLRELSKVLDCPLDLLLYGEVKHR